ncbi:MAG: hypothetical protein K8R31_09065 [Bacteroidales bacterium]|nr:hypothetical protein [Bacteroidales bacterium]
MNNKEIIKNLRSEKTSIILDTLKYISENGNKDIIIEVIELLRTTSDTIIRDKIIEILDNLREQYCVPPIIKAIENPDYKDILSILVSSCWKNSLDFDKYIEVFTDIFIQSDFQLAFDAFTVIDNFENIDIQLADTCLLRLENYVEDITNDKKPLYFELINVIENMIKNPAE